MLVQKTGKRLRAQHPFEISRNKKRPAARAVGRFVFLMWYLRGSNQGHADFQSTALPLS